MRSSHRRLAAHSAIESGFGAVRRPIAGAKGHLRDPLFQRAVAELRRAGVTSSFRTNERAVDRRYRLPHVSARAPVAEW